MSVLYANEEQFAFYDTLYGLFRIGYIGEEVTMIRFASASDVGVADVPTVITDRVFDQLQEYFCGERECFDLPLRMIGTEFQKRVWGVLADIPYGETRSYKQIAEAIGQPTASRAVGMANNRNRLVIVLPCHRVVGANGMLVGYAGGLELKESLLSLEKVCKKR